MSSLTKEYSRKCQESGRRIWSVWSSMVSNESKYKNYTEAVHAGRAVRTCHVFNQDSKVLEQYLDILQTLEPCYLDIV